MKRLFILASAAIVALASCTKTEVVYNEAPQEIGFKAVTGVMTKADQTGAMTQNMGVFANLLDGTSYFGNTVFTSTGTEWVSAVDNKKYWPVNGNKLCFAVYSPYQQTGVTYAGDKLEGMSADNSGAETIDDQTDYLYGATYFDNTGAGYANQETAVAVNLKHAMAKVTVSFDVENVSVTNVTFSPVVKGTYTVDYSGTSAVVDWEPGSTKKDITLLGNLNSATAASYLVIPETKANISFNYTINGSTNPFSYTITVDSDWEAGTHYTYYVTVKPYEIKFTPEVDTWDNTSDVPVTI